VILVLYVFVLYIFCISNNIDLFCGYRRLPNHVKLYISVLSFQWAIISTSPVRIPNKWHNWIFTVLLLVMVFGFWEADGLLAVCRFERRKKGTGHLIYVILNFKVVLFVR